MSIVIKAITNAGSPIPSPTPIAILSDRLNFPSGLSSFVPGSSAPGSVKLPVSVAVWAGLRFEVLDGGSVVVVGQAQVSDKVQYAPSWQHIVPQHASTEVQRRYEFGQHVRDGSGASFRVVS